MAIRFQCTYIFHLQCYVRKGFYVFIYAFGSYHYPIKYTKIKINWCIIIYTTKCPCVIRLKIVEGLSCYLSIFVNLGPGIRIPETTGLNVDFQGAIFITIKVLDVYDFLNNMKKHEYEYSSYWNDIEKDIDFIIGTASARTQAGFICASARCTPSAWCLTVLPSNRIEVEVHD